MHSIRHFLTRKSMLTSVLLYKQCLLNTYTVYNTQRYTRCGLYTLLTLRTGALACGLCCWVVFFTIKRNLREVLRSLSVLKQIKSCQRGKRAVIRLGNQSCRTCWLKLCANWLAEWPGTGKNRAMELVESVNGIQIENLIYLSKQKYRTLYSSTAQTFRGFKGSDCCWYLFFVQIQDEYP